jgi:NTE family protein
VPTHPPFECIALLLQGGGALGAYQAGVYQALAEADLHPDWVAGISIGAINCALIAGNPPKLRLERLRTFWETISAPPLGLDPFGLELEGDIARAWINQMRAFGVLLAGAPQFFAPRMMPPFLHPRGSMEALSYYDTAPLRATLELLIDFDLLNRGATRCTVGAVNVRTGNLVCFDSTTHRLRPEHVIASGSLPPGFPATEIEGEHYWGWRAGLQHAAAMGAGQPAALGHRGVPGRSVEFQGRAAARPDRIRGAAEGNPLLQPDPGRD